MLLSAFSVIDGVPDSARDRYREAVDLAVECDRSGLHAFWVAEHHFQPGGVCPSPPVLLASAGARTRRIRLGSLVSVLPFHNPVEIAEQYALLDRLVDGRLNLGVGSGYIASELEAFGVNPASKRDTFDRNLATVLTAFRGEPVRVHPPRSPEVTLNVRPHQRPHPPITVAVQRREALEFVARAGYSVALIPYATVRDVAELAEQIREFRAHLPDGSRATVAAGVHVYAGSDVAVARRAFRQYLTDRLATQSTFYKEKVREAPTHASAEAIEAAGLAAFGSPEEVVTRLEAFRRAGVDELLGIFDFGGLPADDALASVRALGARWASGEPAPPGPAER